MLILVCSVTGSTVSERGERQKTVGISLDGLHWRRCDVIRLGLKDKDEKCP